jgi:UDP-N-acetylmuramoyl-tripeptide--D-alanyl-D-alanine ligase
LAAALDALAAIGRRGRRRTVAVLGEMLELGESSPDDHAGVGEHLARLGIDVLVTVGEPAGAIAAGTRRTPGWMGETVFTAGRDEAVAWLRHNVVARDVVLVKASRGAALEHVADALIGADGAAAEDEEGGNPSR